MSLHLKSAVEARFGDPIPSAGYRSFGLRSLRALIAGRGRPQDDIARDCSGGTTRRASTFALSHPRTFALDLRRALAATLVAACAVLSSAPALAQGNASVDLQVTDGETGAPLAGATVRLDGVIRAVSDTTGRVVLLGLEPGRHLLDVAMLGRRAVSPEIEIARGESVVLEVVLESEAVVLPGVEASSRRRSASVIRAGRGRGGRRIGRNEIARSTATRLGELLIRLGALQPDGHLRQARCGPRVVADGIMLGDTDLDIFPVQDVEAVEIYSIGGVPPEFGGSLAGVCGVVAVWTRHQ